MAEPKRYLNYVNGKWTPPGTGKYYRKCNPANYDDVIGEFPLSAAADVDAAVQSCHRAFKETWGKMLVNDREKVINKFIELVDKNKEEIARALTREQGKTYKEALGEPSRGVVECRYILGEGQRLEGITMPSDRKGVVSVATRVPLGVVAAIAPWNFPFLTPLRKIMPALACGNTVLFKPASETPHCGVLLMELFDQAGLPPGVVNMVIGRGADLGDAISGHPLVRGITFTGSTAVGRRINEHAAVNFTRCQLEMGGKNPAIVANFKNLPSAAAQLSAGGFALAGQRCTVLSRVIVLQDQAEELENLIAEHLKGFVLGDGMDPAVSIGPVMNQKAGEDILAYIQSARDEGAVIKAGGKRLTGGIYDRGFWIEPTLITRVKPAMKVAREEIFGPVLVILRADTFEEALAIANDTEYGLAAALFTDDLDKIYAFQQEIEAGMAHINHSTVTDGTMPFGGVKHSGVGPFSKGKTNKDFFTQLKVVYTKYF